jgi:ribonuclease HI
MEPIVIYTDGGARGNPGPAAAGYMIYADGNAIEGKKFLGEKQTNNWAEYEAVSLALEKAIDLGLSGREVTVRMDSKLVVEQISGNWKIKEATLKPQAAKAHVLLKEFKAWRFEYVPREQNKEADRLVNEALDETL